MKHIMISIMSGLLIIACVIEVYSQTKRKARIHPTFSALLKTYPRNKPILNPEVPRISAKIAHNFYLANSAVFFSTGNLAHNHKIPRTYALPEGKETHNSIIKKVKRIKNKIIILYCD